MKLCLDPLSAACRPILMFVHDHGMLEDSCRIELASDRDDPERWRAMKRADKAPLLTDGDLVLTQAPTILRYLADRSCSPAYPMLKGARARVDAALDWIGAELAHDLCHDYLYPRLLPHRRYTHPRTQAEVERRGLSVASARLTSLDDQMSTAGCRFICGDQITIADYLAAGVLGFADACGFSFAQWPRVTGWLRHMKSRPSWASTHFAVAGVGARRSWLSVVARVA